jgi:hypothetical protein
MSATITGDFAGKPIETSRMPGHWVLARLGKRVLRPGGRELTRRMLDALAVNRADRVIEFAPGLGETARYVLDETGAEYTGIEQDAHAAEWLNQRFDGTTARFIHGSAAQTVKILWNMLHQAGARERVLGMRRVFRKYSRNLTAICIVARKIQPC